MNSAENKGYYPGNETHACFVTGTHIEAKWTQVFMIFNSFFKCKSIREDNFTFRIIAVLVEKL